MSWIFHRELKEGKLILSEQDYKWCDFISKTGGAGLKLQNKYVKPDANVSIW